MTMITTTAAPAAKRSLRRILLMRAATLRRTLNNWIASIIAHRERQAAIVALSELNDRELKDIGIYRGQIFQTLENAAIARSRHHRPLA
jgi:uncharacterized protein YjiS (DUF1127 family)